MKISRNMLHEDLQASPVYWMQMMFKYLFRYKWTAKLAHQIIDFLSKKGRANPSIIAEDRYLPTTDGEAEILVKIYRPAGTTAADKLPAMLYTHGGGYISGCPEHSEWYLTKFIERRPCIIVAPAYRNAFVKPYPAAFDDCYMTLLWMRDNADELGIDASKFIIAGHSAGGGLAAAVTLKTRDTKDVNVAFQMPFYPMIDDQQPFDPARYIDCPIWDTRTNTFGWASYLKDLHAQNAEIPAYAAPARNTNFNDLPPTVTFVGNYEPFYGETVEYVRKLKEAGVEVAFKEYDRCTHGFDLTIPRSPPGRDAIGFSIDTYADFYDKYVVG